MCVFLVYVLLLVLYGFVILYADGLKDVVEEMGFLLIFIYV